MSNACILTDGSAQFTRANYLGYERVFIAPFTIQELPPPEGKRGRNGYKPTRLVPPSREDFSRFYAELSRQYEAILVLTLSGGLHPAVNFALSALEISNDPSRIRVVDSQTTGIGLGLLVQAAAAAASAGDNTAEIEHRVRALIPHVYTLVSVPQLSVLPDSGYMEYSQAVVGEILGIVPIFTIEEGRLKLMEKVRTQRHLVESFVVFLNEFDAPAHIALMHGDGINTHPNRPIRQSVQVTFPNTPFSEHVLSPCQAALFGPDSTCLVIMDKVK